MKSSNPCSISLFLSSASASAIPNANHIFNSLQDSMRQFGSSLHHNGMSFFVAHVPADTELYHGTHTPYRVNGTEWLAFEPEHALIFTRGGRPPRHRPDFVESQHPLNADEPGYLHTYRARHPLRLLYIDGEAAAKSEKGTLDTTDRILLHDTPPYSEFEDHERPSKGPLGEALRADNLCSLASQDWNDRIDGFLRMEGGFEIILCDFATHLNLVRATQAMPRDSRGMGLSYGYMRAVAIRYDGIGGGRVRLDYGDFVSAYPYDELVFFEDGLPRIDNSSREVQNIREDVKRMVMRPHRFDADLMEWRDIADLVVARYSDRIELLSTPAKFSTLDEFLEEVGLAMRPFIDYSFRNSHLEIHRCAHQYLPSQPSTLTAYNAILNVTTTLCSALDATSRATSIEQGLEIMIRLRTWLDWSSFRICRGCQAGEICYVPIWPMGSKEDLEQPRCMNESQWKERKDGYWDNSGFPKPPPPPMRLEWQGL